MTISIIIVLSSIGLNYYFADYSAWRYAFTPNYAAIKQGQNKITAKISCAASPTNLTKISSLNVTGVGVFHSVNGQNDKNGANGANGISSGGTGANGGNGGSAIGGSGGNGGSGGSAFARNGGNAFGGGNGGNGGNAYGMNG